MSGSDFLRKMTVVWAVYLLLLVVGRRCRCWAGVVLPPVNVASPVSTPVTLRCHTDGPDETVHWVYYTDVDMPWKSIYVGDKTGDFDAKQYDINSTSPGQHDLIILSPSFDGPKIFGCRGNEGWDEARVSMLLVHDQTPLCGNNLGRGTLARRTVTLSCRVRFSGNFKVSLVWHRPDGTELKVCNDSRAGRIECDIEVDFSSSDVTQTTCSFRIDSPIWLPNGADSSIPAMSLGCQPLAGIRWETDAPSLASSSVVTTQSTGRALTSLRHSEPQSDQVVASTGPEDTSPSSLPMLLFIVGLVVLALSSCLAFFICMIVRRGRARSQRDAAAGADHSLLEKVDVMWATHCGLPTGDHQHVVDSKV